MRIANRNSKDYVKQLKPFQGSNLHAVKTSAFYIVYSYGWYPLFLYDYKNNVWFENEDKYSMSTSKQTTQARPTNETIKLNKHQIKSLI
jgi:hypothetical protein